jgi:hypothetical protein
MIRAVAWISPCRVAESRPTLDLVFGAPSDIAKAQLLSDRPTIQALDLAGRVEGKVACVTGAARQSRSHAVGEFLLNTASAQG